MDKIKTILFLILIVVFIIVVLQNTQTVTLRFLFWQIHASRIILLPMFAVVGFIAGYIVAKMTRKPKEEH